MHFFKNYFDQNYKFTIAKSAPFKFSITLLSLRLFSWLWFRFFLLILKLIRGRRQRSQKLLQLIFLNMAGAIFVEFFEHVPEYVLLKFILKPHHLHVLPNELACFVDVESATFVGVVNVPNMVYKCVNWVFFFNLWGCHEPFWYQLLIWNLTNRSILWW